MSRPVNWPFIFSYAEPFGKDHSPNVGFMDVPLTAVNCVELPNGPSLTEAKVHWKGNNKLLLTRGNIHIEYSGQQLLNLWPSFLDLGYSDGMNMDEFTVCPKINEIGCQRLLPHVAEWTSAFLQLDQRYPERVWTALIAPVRPTIFLDTEQGKDALKILNDHASVIIPEFYLYEGLDGDNRLTDEQIHDALFSLLTKMEQIAPCVINKTAIGLNLERSPGTAIGASVEFIRRQIAICSGDLFFKRTLGIALYRPGFMTDLELYEINNYILNYIDSTRTLQASGKLLRILTVDGHFAFTLVGVSGYVFRITQNRITGKELQFPSAVPLLCAAMQRDLEVQVFATRAEPGKADVDEIIVDVP